jgi:hypothetical protein
MCGWVPVCGCGRFLFVAEGARGFSCVPFCGSQRGDVATCGITSCLVFSSLSLQRATVVVAARAVEGAAEEERAAVEGAAAEAKAEAE